jgi:hypothetical protein
MVTVGSTLRRRSGRSRCSRRQPRTSRSVADDSDDQHEPLPRFEIEDADVGRGLTKVGGTLAAHLANVGEDERLTAIVKVAEPGYVPQGVRQRAAIGPTIFTAILTRRELAALDRDPQVVSIELSTRLRPTDS